VEKRLKTITNDLHELSIVTTLQINHVRIR
jgi:hypothetical protein